MKRITTLISLLIIPIFIFADSKEEWINPSHKICTSNGGEVSTFTGACEANWLQANKICILSGGRLPSITELLKVVADCGGTRGNFTKNKNSSTYRPCFLRNGFHSMDRYWSSTKDNAKSNIVQVLDFNYAAPEHHKENAYHYTRCIKNNEIEDNSINTLKNQKSKSSISNPKVSSVNNGVTMSLSECANLTTKLKEAETKKDYNEVMNIGGMIFLGCDGHVSPEQMNIVLEAIDRAEMKYNKR